MASLSGTAWDGDEEELEEPVSRAWESRSSLDPVSAALSLMANPHHETNRGEELASKRPAPEPGTAPPGKGARRPWCCFSFSSVERDNEMQFWEDDGASPVVTVPALAMEDLNSASDLGSFCGFEPTT